MAGEFDTRRIDFMTISIEILPQFSNYGWGNS